MSLTNHLDAFQEKIVWSVLCNMDGKSWLEFVQLGDNAKEFATWCKEHNVEQTEEYAELYVEQTEERLWQEQEGAV